MWFKSNSDADCWPLFCRMLIFATRNNRPPEAMAKRASDAPTASVSREPTFLEPRPLGDPPTL